MSEGSAVPVVPPPGPAPSRPARCSLGAGDRRPRRPDSVPSGSCLPGGVGGRRPLARRLHRPPRGRSSVPPSVPGVGQGVGTGVVPRCRQRTGSRCGPEPRGLAEAQPLRPLSVSLRAPGPTDRQTDTMDTSPVLSWRGRGGLAGLGAASLLRLTDVVKGVKRGEAQALLQA